jgi:hypothetical protein
MSERIVYPAAMFFCGCVANHERMIRTCRGHEHIERAVLGSLRPQPAVDDVVQVIAALAKNTQYTKPFDALVCELNRHGLRLLRTPESKFGASDTTGKGE